MSRSQPLDEEVPGWGGSPTVDTLVAIVAVFALQGVLGFIGLGGLFVAQSLGNPLSLLLSVYAHGGLGHLVSNAVSLVLLGFLVERSTTRVRFHAFFLTAGVIAAVAQVIASPGGVLGASGAIFALLGYLLTGNSLSASVFDRLELPARAQIIILAVVAGILTFVGAGPGIALVAHFAGLLVGLVAGRFRILAA
jgi:membrane associated rhomboid family serine protease